jgi:hypothetical protein
LKFHPGDKDYLAEFGAEWLLRKDVPKANPNDEKRKAMAAKKKAPSAEAALPEEACFLSKACSTSCTDTTRMYSMHLQIWIERIWIPNNP